MNVETAKKILLALCVWNVLKNQKINILGISFTIKTILLVAVIAVIPIHGKTHSF
jgi:hypothetical protein